MEDATRHDVFDGSGLGYLEALKIVALSIGSVLGILCVVFWFMAEAWVRGIAQEELAGGVTLSGEQAMKLTEHAGLLWQHDEEIEDNEDKINKVDEKFTQFVRDVIDRL
jgi:archaellum biogenesis protein FlaJ (TadC family)